MKGASVASVLTPEGVELQFPVASASERLVAVAIDLCLIALTLFVCGLLLALTLGDGAVLLLAFFLRQGYFLCFETRWNGSTPGKSRFHLRVIRADGGQLSAEILLARNLTREVELFMPLTVVFVPGAMGDGSEGLTQAVASLWILLLALFPLCNAQRLRVGDLLAGTRVVVAPQAALLRDIADAGSEVVSAARGPGFVFTPEQLSIYGEHELQVLEDVLRKGAAPGGKETLAAVVVSITRRIDWADAAALRGRHGEFLRAFYTAQRQHLEQRLLLGQRRERKRTRW